MKRTTAGVDDRPKRETRFFVGKCRQKVIGIDRYCNEDPKPLARSRLLSVLDAANPPPRLIPIMAPVAAGEMEEGHVDAADVAAPTWLEICLVCGKRPSTTSNDRRLTTLFSSQYLKLLRKQGIWHDGHLELILGLAGQKNDGEEQIETLICTILPSHVPHMDVMRIVKVFRQAAMTTGETKRSPISSTASIGQTMPTWVSPGSCDTQLRGAMLLSTTSLRELRVPTSFLPSHLLTTFRDAFHKS